MTDTTTITRSVLSLERGPQAVELKPAADGDAQANAIRILVADHDPASRESCANLLRHEGLAVTACARGAEAIDLLDRRAFPLVLVDRDLPGIDGLAVLHCALKVNADALVVLTSDKPTVASSVEALENGAWDYLPKPFSATQLQILMGRAAQAVRVREQERARSASGERLGGDPAMAGKSFAFRRILDVAARVALTDASVFITGESGVGKELVARFIHERSRRANRPFIAVNCAAIPETLLESEMFGHRRGAFTDAVRDKVGLLEAANGGTLFLDELLEMAPSIQAKLLRAIQDGVVRRVGSETTDAVVNVRYIAATNRLPDDAVRDGTLREDLLYRLQVIPIHVPALRERREDIVPLAVHFVDVYWARHRASGDEPPRFTDAALSALSEHTWPGNVRELQNVVEHAVVFSQPGRAIDVSDLPFSEGPWRPRLVTDTPPSAIHDCTESFHAVRERVVADFEVEYLMRLVERAGGNMARAARLAGIDRATLYRMMERHGLHRRRDAIGLVERGSTDVPAVPQLVRSIGSAGRAVQAT